MRRTCQTTLISLQWLIKSNVPVEVDAMWQENSTQPCDTGTPLPTLQKEFPSLDFTSVDPTYPGKSHPHYAFTRSANKIRGEVCLQNLYSRPEKVIAVVGHSGFLRTGITKRRFANADYRIFTFKGLELFEDEGTERKGGGLGRSQRGIFEVREGDFPREESEGEGAEEETEHPNEEPRAAGSWLSPLWSLLAIFGGGRR